MTVYLDLVMGLNFAVDLLLLLGTNRLTGYPSGVKRAAAAASLGAVYAGGCMLPGFAFLGNTLWRLVSLGLMAVVAFGVDRSAVQRGAVFVLLSMAMGGIAMGTGGKGIAALVLCAAGVWLLCKAGFRGSLGRREYVQAELWHGERSVRLTALRDTGNTLKDPVTGEQVLVAGADVGAELLGLTEEQLRRPVETLSSGAVTGLRLIPYRAVGQSGGLLLAVRLDRAVIGGRESKALVAFAPEPIARKEGYRMLTGGAV